MINTEKSDFRTCLPASVRAVEDRIVIIFLLITMFWLGRMTGRWDTREDFMRGHGYATVDIYRAANNLAPQAFDVELKQRLKKEGPKQ